MVDEKKADEVTNTNVDNADEAHDLLEIDNESNTMEKTLEEVENLKHQIELLEDKLLRTNAESENIRKRYEKMIEDARDYSISNFTKDLLNVMDNLSRALEHKPDELNEQMNSMFSGVDMTKNELASVFRKHGLESIEPQAGEKFDYNLHHAVAQIVTDEHDEGSIVNTMQVGYKIKDRLLRPAIVRVSKKDKGFYKMVNKVIFWTLVIAFLVTLLTMISKTLTPFFIAFILAYGLQPLIDKLHLRYKLARTPVVYGIFIIFITTFIIGISVLMPILYHQTFLLISKIPEYKAYLQNELLPILTKNLHSVDPNIADKMSGSMKGLINSTFSLISGIFNNIWDYTMATINTIGIILLTPIILLYFLKDWSKMIAHIDGILPLKEKSKIRQILSSINQLLSGYIRGQFNVCLLLSAFYGLSLSLIGIDLGLLLGLLSGFLIIIPFIGLFVAFLLSLTICYFSFGISPEIAYVAILYLVGGLLETYILTPKIIGDRIGLHPLWIMFAVFATGSLFGFVGILFAIPIAGIIKVLLGYGIDFYKSSKIYKI